MWSVRETLPDHVLEHDHDRLASTDRVIDGRKQDNADGILVPDHVPEVWDGIVERMLGDNELIVVTITLLHTTHIAYY